MDSNIVYAENCGCKNKEKPGPMPDPQALFPETVEYGNAYVPFQQPVEKLYRPEDALLSGTIFPELDQPYMPKRRGRRG